METKKILVPTIIAIVTLVILTVGATFAYFTFGSDNEFGTQTIEATTGALGSGVSLSKVENSDLTLAVSAVQMLQTTDSSDLTYYATGSQTPQNVGKFSVAGSGNFDCTYTLTITKSATDSSKDMYTKFQSFVSGGTYSDYTGQVFLTVNDQTYDFATANLFTGTNNDTITYSGSVSNISEAQDEYITANMAIVNKGNVDQTSLNDSEIKLTFSIADLSCTLVEATTP